MTNYETALRDALTDCLIALGHVGVKLTYERTQDADAAKFLIALELDNPGGLNGICQRAFEKAQSLLQPAPESVNLSRSKEQTNETTDSDCR